MIGYCAEGYKRWDEEKQNVVVARNVIFDERIKKEEEYYNNRQPEHVGASQRIICVEKSYEEDLNENENELNENEVGENVQEQIDNEHTLD